MLLLFKERLMPKRITMQMNNVISKKFFDEQLLNKGFFGVSNDSLNKHKIIFTCDRWEKGTLGDAPNLFKVLSEKLHLPLDYNKPLIIYYYPGKDPCNSGGKYSVRREYLKSESN